MSNASSMEVNVKTLDSRDFSFQVDTNMLVSVLKEKIASEVGLPVGQQRLIFRGKVLNDDYPLSEYHVENGHTLHLVERQPTESQGPPGTAPGEASSTTAQDPNANGVPAGIGQLAQSVLLGSLNVGNQGDGVVADISQVLGQVLNSIALGNQTATNATGHENVLQVPQGTQSQADNRAQTELQFTSQSFPQFLQMPMMSIPTPIPIPVNMSVPHSLTSLSEFMTRMEQGLQIAGSPGNESLPNSEDQPAFNLPTNADGLPTPEALITVLRHAQRLLSERVTVALSHMSNVLEREGNSTDATVRNQIQSETVHLANAITHLGSLMLELGRTILMLHMGQSPAEAYVDAVPAMYINSYRANPILVQPSPPLFGEPDTSLNSENLGPADIGAVPRQVDIHIHTGQAVSSDTQVPSSTSGAGDDVANNQLRDLPGSGDRGLQSSSSGSAPVPSQGGDNSERGTAVPLGLGLGGLQPKPKSKEPVTGKKTSNGTTSSASNQNQEIVTNRRTMVGQSDDIANAITEVLHNPALSGLLNGVGQIAQQFDGQDLGNMLSGMGIGQGGGFDLAGMVQQMMPIVSQTLHGGPTPSQQHVSQSNVIRNLSRHETASNQNYQNDDLQEVLERTIDHDEPVRELYNSILELSSLALSHRDDLLNELIDDDSLIEAFMDVVERDIGERFGDC